MLKVSVDRAVILANLAGANRPPLCIQVDGNPSCVYAFEVVIPGPCRVVYKPAQADADDPSASVWIEVEGDVTVL